MKKSRFIALTYCLLYLMISTAQYDHQDVFTDLQGEALREALASEFRPVAVLTYGMARDTLFKNIDAVDDSLECAYTGMKRYLDPDEDPTITVFLNGDANGINTEHSYPQSKGAGDGNPRSDMHHLYPTRARTNSARGSKIFKDVNDSQTTTWFRGTVEKSSTPSSNIDEWSELGNDTFEPREEIKGNIARSIMYFYTMYKAQADAADPAFFNLQRETLCDWHYADPVDQVEWERTQKIAEYQEGKANPFVLDCSLASRIYCQGISAACQAVEVDNILQSEVNIYPNPTTDYLVIDGIDSEYTADIINYTGTASSAKVTNQTISTEHLTPGVYMLRIIVGSEYLTKIFIKI